MVVDIELQGWYGFRIGIESLFDLETVIKETEKKGFKIVNISVTDGDGRKMKFNTALPLIMKEKNFSALKLTPEEAFLREYQWFVAFDKAISEEERYDSRTNTVVV